MGFDEIAQYPPFALSGREKGRLLLERLGELTEFYRQNCPEYARILDCMGFRSEEARSLKGIPFLPARLFKELSLKSVPDAEIIKTVTSSGTAGQTVSKIYLDRTTSANQQKAMVKIVSDFIGPARMPMVLIDCPSVVKDRAMFSARGAGLLGFSLFGSRRIYALDDSMKLDVDALAAFLKKHEKERLLLFGFTFMIWQHFYRELVRLKSEGVIFDLSRAVMIHGGGWKKLEAQSVDHDEFHRQMREVCGISEIHDYYGMVEQTGCIYMECACGHLHASVFSDVITRRPLDFAPCETGERGILQVLSVIPQSYPGHSLLTEDEGVILGEDNCPCGRKGKYFKILGRLKWAELRGCSDTYETDLRA